MLEHVARPHPQLFGQGHQPANTAHQPPPPEDPRTGGEHVCRVVAKQTNVERLSRGIAWFADLCVHICPSRGQRPPPFPFVWAFPFGRTRPQTTIDYGHQRTTHIAGVVSEPVTKSLQ